MKSLHSKRSLSW